MSLSLLWTMHLQGNGQSRCGSALVHRRRCGARVALQRGPILRSGTGILAHLPGSRLGRFAIEHMPHLCDQVQARLVTQSWLG